MENEKICYAVGSKLVLNTEEERHVLFIDIDVDKHDDKKITDEAYAILKFARLTHLLIYKTRHGYNLVSFDLLTADKIKKIHNLVKNDIYHSLQFDEYGQWFLRLNAGKVVLSMILNDEKINRDVSFAHMLEFKRNSMLKDVYIDAIVMNTLGRLRSGIIRIDYYKRKKEVENAPAEGFH